MKGRRHIVDIRPEPSTEEYYVIISQLDYADILDSFPPSYTIHHYATDTHKGRKREWYIAVRNK